MIVRHDQETLIKMTAVDVFVGNYTLIDFELYDLWLNGYTGKLVVFSESRIFAVEACLYIVITPKVQCKWSVGKMGSKTRAGPGILRLKTGFSDITSKILVHFN